MQYVQQRMYASSNRRGHDTRKWKFARRMSDSRRGHEENKMSFIELSDKRILRQKSRFTIETQSVKEKAGNGIISYSRISDSGRRDKRRQRSNKDRIEERERERERLAQSLETMFDEVLPRQEEGACLSLFLHLNEIEQSCRTLKRTSREQKGLQLHARSSSFE